MAGGGSPTTGCPKPKKGMKMQMLTESIKSAFETVLALEAAKKALDEQIKKARDTIRKSMDEQEITQIKQEGYYANIASATRKSLVTEEVEKLLGYKIPDTCFKQTNYTTLTIKRGELV